MIIIALKFCTHITGEENLKRVNNTIFQGKRKSQNKIKALYIEETLHDVYVTQNFALYLFTSYVIHNPICCFLLLYFFKADLIYYSLPSVFSKRYKKHDS